jgi:FkbM family methyltransferase
VTLASRAAGAVPDRAFTTAIAHAHRRFEPELRDVVSACDPDGVALDVGAWFGPWTHWLARRVEHVHAFEPNPDVATVLRSTVRRNVTVHQLAVSDAGGTASLSLSGKGLGAEGRSSLQGLPDATRHVEVPRAPLDSFDLERVRFVKIDVEGHELAALRGAHHMLERWHPVLLVELEARHGDTHAVVDLLTSMGYRGHFRVRGRWTALDEALLLEQQRRHEPSAMRSYLRQVLQPGEYPNNVLFVHPDSTWSPVATS